MLHYPLSVIHCKGQKEISSADWLGGHMTHKMFNLIITAITTLPMTHSEKGQHLLDLAIALESACNIDPELVILWSDLAPVIEQYFLACASGGRQYASVVNAIPFHSLTKWITEEGAQHMNDGETVDWADSIMACSIHY